MYVCVCSSKKQHTQTHRGSSAGRRPRSWRGRRRPPPGDRGLWTRGRWLLLGVWSAGGCGGGKLYVCMVDAFLTLPCKKTYRIRPALPWLFQTPPEDRHSSRLFFSAPGAAIAPAPPQYLLAEGPGIVQVKCCSRMTRRSRCLALVTPNRSIETTPAPGSHFFDRPCNFICVCRCGWCVG